MHKKILLILFVLMSFDIAKADYQRYGDIIQRQSRQIQELKSQVLDLEKDVQFLKDVLSSNNILKKDSNFLGSRSVSGGSEDINSDNDLLNSIDSSYNKDKTSYDNALAALKDGKFELAEEQFLNFISSYKNSNYRSNATFWYAETFYRRGIFDKAAINYLKSYKEYPKSSKSSDALLRLSYSLHNLNKDKEACSMLSKLEVEFPERSMDSIRRTDEARDKFHCNKLIN